MSRNRFKHTHSLHWAAVLKCLLIIGTLAFLGMSYVLMKNQIFRLSTQVRDLDAEDRTWRKRNSQLESNINRLTSYTMLQQKVNELGLGLVKIAELDVKDMGHENVRYAQNRYGAERVIPVSLQVQGNTESHP